MTVFHLQGMQNLNFSNSSYAQRLHFSSVISKNCGSDLQNVSGLLLKQTANA